MFIITQTETSKQKEKKKVIGVHVRRKPDIAWVTVLDFLEYLSRRKIQMLNQS